MSSGESCSTMGIANPSVLPEPVCDLASVSRPEVASWITITWIGNGSVDPALGEGFDHRVGYTEVSEGCEGRG